MQNRRKNMNFITMVHVMGIKESVEAKLHCRNIAGSLVLIPVVNSDIRITLPLPLFASLVICQAGLCMMSLNVRNDVIQTLPALTYLILQER